MSGDRYERELVNALTTLNIPALRAPSSGSATDRNLPDILAGMKTDEQTIKTLLKENTSDSVSNEAIKNAGSLLAPTTHAYGIESKSQEGTTLYVKTEEVEKLRSFCEEFGGEPRLGARYTERRHPTEHFLVHPSDARLTEEDNYGLPVTDIRERASEIVQPGTTTEDPAIEFVDSPRRNRSI